MRFIRRFFQPPADDGPTILTPLPFAEKNLAQHLEPGGRKRILALDGGGVRGVMSIAVLERIEALLRARHGNHPDFGLWHYYDLIGGTSTGSIIAAAIAAKKFSAAQIKDFYFTMGPEVFKKNFLRRGFTRAVFNHKRLQKKLEEVFGDMTLGHEDIATGLAVVSKRVDTDSVWVMHNHPRGIFYEDGLYSDKGIEKRYIGNKQYPLVNIIRASTAAPHFFKPERIEIVKGEIEGFFVDGGVTPHNNPAFQMMMLAGLRNYSFHWSLTHDNLLMTSIGTGSMADRTPPEAISKRLQIANTFDALTSMISTAEDFIELLMQWVGDGPDPRVIDSEIGDLREEFITNEPLVFYNRYQCVLTERRLKQDYGFNISEKHLETVRVMTDPDAMPIAYEIGQAIAEKTIREEHFPHRFDLTSENAPTENTNGLV